MRLSRKQLQNLRSGQTVWRVWGYSRKGLVEVHCQAYQILGKKVLHHFEGGYKAWRMKCRRIEILEQARARRRSYENAARYLNDLHGLGAFTSARHAQRFVDEIHAGLHPHINERLIEDEEMDARMYEYDDYDDYGYEDHDNWGDQGD